MPLPRLLNAAYAWARAQLVANCDRASWAGKDAAAAAVAHLERFDRLMDGGDSQAGEPDRERWGTGPAAEAAQNSMLALTAGG